ncbi:MAG: hypothetical protein JW755_07120 [Candidatus Aminicenantes bacterium]|nr:hypothetical protein [Candidatus Aminicenantes bacterium]
MKKNILIVSGCLILFLTGISQLYSQDYKVIVNQDNPVSKLKRSVVSDLFLKKQDDFPDGMKALPVDLIPTHPIRGKFSDNIHKKRVRAIEAYWQQQIFSGQGVPPPVKNTEDEIIEYVLNNLGAIGYVSVSIAAPGVKEIEID